MSNSLPQAVPSPGGARLVNRLLPDAVRTLAFRILSLVVQVVAFAFIARTHSLEAVGIYAVINTLLVIGRMVGPMGCDYAAYKFCGAYIENGQHGRMASFARLTSGYVLAATVSISIVLLALDIAWTHFLGALVAREVTLLFALALPVYALSGLFSSLQRVRGDIAWAQLPDGLFLSGLTLVGVAAAYMLGHVDIRLTLAVQTAAAAIALGATMLRWRIAVGRGGEPLERAEWREILATARRLVAGTVVANLAVRAPIILVSAVLGPLAAGIFEAASRFGTLATLTSYASNAAIAPLLSRARARGDRGEIQDLYTLGSLLHVAPAAGILLLLIAFGESLLTLILGERYAIAHGPMIVIALMEVIACSGATAGPLLQMSGNELAVIRYSLRSLIIACIGIPIAAALFGLIGATCVLIACAFARDIAMARHAARIYEIRPGVLSIEEWRRCYAMLRSRGVALVLQFRWGRG